MDPVIRRPEILPDPVVNLIVEEKLLIADVKQADLMFEFPETNLNLDSVKGFKQKKKEIKYLKLKSEAIRELRNALQIFKPEELKLNHSVVLFCCQIVEDLFTSKQKGYLKKDVVIEVCKDFFDGKHEVVEMVVDLVFDKIIKTSFIRRNKNKIKSVGFFLLEKISPNLQTFSQSKLRAL
jgi:hypothetical protein